MAQITPTETVQVGGRNFIGGTTYSVDDATVEAIEAALGTPAEEPQDEPEPVEAEEAPAAADDEPEAADEAPEAAGEEIAPV